MLRLSLLSAMAFFLPPAVIFGQVYNPAIDVRHYVFALNVNDSNDKIQGKATVTLVFKEDIGSFHLDLAAKNKEGKGMTVRSVTKDDQPIRFTQDSSHLILLH